MSIHQIIALSIDLMYAKYQLSHMQTVGLVRISVKIPGILILIHKKRLKSKSCTFNPWDYLLHEWALNKI